MEKQNSLFDIGLKFSHGRTTEDFTDELGKRLNELRWDSTPRHGFIYDEYGSRKLSDITISLKCSRRTKKNGKTELVLERGFTYSGIDDVFEDEIPCQKIEELESLFNGEKESFEAERALPKDVLFDGRRYCWKFTKNEDSNR